jgi:hypothetical protein
MFRLDYISCLLTILSTAMIGRRVWQGWLVAGANSVVICVIGLRTAQTGFVPANLFCLALYGYNIAKWKAAKPEAEAATEKLVPDSKKRKPRAAARIRPRRLRRRLALRIR